MPFNRKRKFKLMVVSFWFFTFGAFLSQNSLFAADKETAAQNEKSKDVVARIGDEIITAMELNEAAKDELKSIESQIYDIKMNKLDEMVNEKLWQLEAGKQKKSIGDVQDEALKGANPGVTDAEVDNIFMQSQGRFGNSTEEAKGKIRELLKKQKLSAVSDNYAGNLKNKYPVKILLEAPRFQIDMTGRPIRGNVNAPVTVVEVSDFECTYCSKIQTTIRQLRETYKEQVRFSFMHFPLPFHQHAKDAAMASLCAEEQGKFWEYRDILFDNRSALAKSDLVSYARRLGLEVNGFQQCLDSGKYNSKIDDDLNAAMKLGVNGTPAFFVNGQPLTGAQPYESFKKIIDRELERK